MKISFTTNQKIGFVKNIFFSLLIFSSCSLTFGCNLSISGTPTASKMFSTYRIGMSAHNARLISSGVLSNPQSLSITVRYITYEFNLVNVTAEFFHFISLGVFLDFPLKIVLYFLLNLIIIILLLFLLRVHLNYLKYRNELYRLLNTMQKFTGVNPYFIKKVNINKYRLLVNALNISLKKIENTFEELEKSVEIRKSEIDKQNERLKEKQKETEHQNIELKSAYEALLESRKRYEQLIDNLKEEYIFFSQAPSGDLLFVSPSVNTILRYSVNEYRKKMNDIYTTNSLNDAARKHKNDSLKGIRQPKYLVELLDKSGTPHVFEITEFPVFNEDNQFTAVEGIARDVTKGVRAEDIIQEKEEKYKLLFNKASDFVFFYNIDTGSIPGKFIEVNEYTVKRLGYSREELHEMTLNNLADVEIWDTEPTVDEFTGNKKYEQIWTSKDGEIINVEIISHTFKLKNKEVGIAIARDITGRKQPKEKE